MSSATSEGGSDASGMEVDIYGTTLTKRQAVEVVKKHKKDFVSAAKEIVLTVFGEHAAGQDSGVREKAVDNYRRALEKLYEKYRKKYFESKKGAPEFDSGFAERSDYPHLSAHPILQNQPMSESDNSSGTSEEELGPPSHQSTPQMSPRFAKWNKVKTLRGLVDLL